MKRLTIIMLLALVPFLAGAQPIGKTAQNQEKYRQGQVIVKFKSKDAITLSNTSQQGRRGMAVSTKAQVNDVIQLLGITEAESLMPLTSKAAADGLHRAQGKHDLSQLYLLHFDSTKVSSVEEAVNALRQLDDVAYAEPNYIFQGFGTTNVTDYTSASLFNSQWYLSAINMPYLWQQPIVNEKRPLIAILDTGVDFTHPNLNGQWTVDERDPGDGIDNDNNGFVDDGYGWSFINNTWDIYDGNGHGTHCAGIAAGTSKDGKGIVGANPDARILDVQILDAYMRGDEATTLNGIDYAVATGADIISMSWGGYVDSQALREALENASQSCVLVAAAGNDQTCIVAQPAFPASYPFVIAVEATDEQGELASFSNYDSDGPLQSSLEGGYNYDVRAPGVSMLSAYPSFGALRGTGYTRMDGTSMACPLVAGAISRLMQCGKFTDFNSLRDLLIKTSGPTIDMKAAYNATVESLNAEDFQCEYNGIMMTFHKTSETTAQLGNGTSAAIPLTTSGTLSIPLTAHGLLVTALAPNAFKGCSKLERLIIPEHVVEIGSHAFADCTQLNYINVASTLAPTCADDAFDAVAYANCSIEVPQNSLQNYNTVSPWSNFNLSQIEHELGETFEVRIDDDGFYITVTNARKKTATLVGYLSYNLQETVEVPEYIGGYQITSLYYAFCDVSWIKHIVLPDCITDISGQCFARSVNLETINFPSQLKRIGSYTFRDCISLKSGHIPGNVKIIDNCAFENSGIEELILDEGVERLGIDAFTHCMKLKKIQIPSSVLSILESFGDLPYVESIKVAEGNPYFDSRDNCNAIVITEDNAIIRGCINTVFPNSVVYGGGFWGVRGLTDIVFMNSAGLTGERLPGTLYVPTSLEFSAGDGSRGLEDLQHITVEKGDGQQYREEVDAVIRYGTLSLGCANSIIPDDVKEISLLAFYRNRGLQSITIPTAMSIGTMAFAGCPLKTITSLSKRPKAFSDSYIVGIGGYSLSQFYDPYYNYYDTDGRSEDHIYETATLYVPHGTTDIYKATDGWNNFQNIVELDPVVTGDVDGNGHVNETDRQALIDHLMHKVVEGYNSTAADADGDGRVNMRDVVAINDMLSGNVPTFSDESPGFGIEPWGLGDLYTGRPCEVSFRTANWVGDEHPIAIYLQVMLPKGMTFDKTQLIQAWGEGGIPDNIETQYSYDDNKVDIVIYSTNNTVLPNRTGVSVVIKVAKDVPPEGYINYSYSIVSDNRKMTDSSGGGQPYHATEKQLELSPINSSQQKYFMYFNSATDLYNNTLENAYYNFDKDNGDVVDTTEGSVVLSSTTTAEQMSSIQNAQVGDDILCDNFHGMILELGMGTGLNCSGLGILNLEAQTKGSHILNVQVGNTKTKRYLVPERKSIEVGYNITEPTYVYVYASSESTEEPVDDGDSNVQLYMYKVDVGSVLRGDVNHDTYIDIADVTVLINHILGVSPIEINNEGDINYDGTHDVFDVMLLINKIMSPSPMLPSPRRRGLQINENYAPLYMTAVDGAVLFNVDNAEQYTSIQLDIEVPDGAELTGAKLTNSGTNHVIRFGKTSKNHYRVIAVSLDNTPLKTDNGNVVQLMVSNNDIQIDNIMFVTPSGEICRFVAQWDNSTTGINEVKTTISQGEVYDLSGRKYNTNPSQKGLYIIDRKKLVIK